MQHLLRPPAPLSALILIAVCSLFNFANAATRAPYSPAAKSANDSTTTDTIRGKSLKEVTVKATRLVFVTKKDTVVYDLDAVEKAEGDMLADALKKMPGMELRGGVLYFQGRPVERVMINGTDFIRGDTKTAIENLPAYMVKSIKAYDRMSDESLATGIDDGKRENTIDIILKRKYLGTWTGNAEAGGTAEKQWLLRAMGMTFTDRARLMAYFGGTNTAAFQSLDDTSGEWYDEQAGSNSGKNTVYKRGGLNGSWNNGIKEGQARHLLVNANASFTIMNHLGDQQKNATETFLDSGSKFNISSQHDKLLDYNLAAGLHAEYNFTKDNWLNFEPSFSFANNRDRTISRSATWNANPYGTSLERGKGMDWPLDSLIAGRLESSPANLTRSMQFTRSRITGYSHNLFFTQKLSERNLRLNLRQQLRYSRSQGFRRELSAYEYFQSAAASQPPLINRRVERPAYTFNELTFLDLNIPLIGKHIFGRATYGLQYSYDKLHHSGYRLDSLGGDFADYDRYSPVFGQLPSDTAEWRLRTREAASSLLSNDYTTTHWLESEMQYDDHRHWYGYLKGQWKPAHEKLDYMRGFRDGIHRSRHCYDVFSEARVRFRHDSIGQAQLSYVFTSTESPFINMIDIPDLTNPLYITTGNPRLRHSKQHQVRFEFRSRNRDQRFCNISANWRAQEGAIVMRTTYDKLTGVTRMRPENVNGKWMAGVMAVCGFPIDHKKRLSTVLQASYSINHDVGFTTSIPTASGRYSTDNHVYSLYGHLYYNHKKVSVMWSSSAAYSRMLSDYASVDGADMWMLNSNLNTDITLPLGMKFSMNVNANYRKTNSTMSYDRWRTICSASLSKSLLRDKSLTLKLRAVDIFNQLDQSGVYISSTERSTYWVNTIGRYVMASLIWRFTTKKSGQK